LFDAPAESVQDQLHVVVDDFLYERVLDIGDRNPARRGGGDVDRIHPRTAERDHLAALEAVEDALGDGSPLGVQRVGVARRLGEVVFSLGRDFDNLRPERTEGFHLQLVARARRSVTHPGRCDNLELRHASPPPWRAWTRREPYVTGFIRLFTPERQRLPRAQAVLRGQPLPPRRP